MIEIFMPAYQLLKLADYQPLNTEKEMWKRTVKREDKQERINDSTVAVSCGIYPMVRTVGSDLFSLLLA